MIDARNAEMLALQEAVAGRYFLERELGRGGMGIVYLARDVALDRLVAIKLLPPALASSGDLRTRFLREARTAAQLSHPHIVPIHAVEEHASVVFFVMGYVDGETLGERVRRAGPLPSADAMRVMQEVAWALAHAHARGVVHRDVKPDNILLERETGRAMVTDFGIARAAASTTPADGIVTGTPQYMSPEQARGEPVDGRSDLYSLGVTFFFAVTGRLPIDAPTAAALVVRLTTESAPSVTSVRSVVPTTLARVIDRCLDATPAGRFASAGDLAETLRTALSARPETPAVIRRFLAEVDAAGVEAGTALIGSIMSLITVWSFRNDLFAGIAFYTLPPVLAMLGAVRLGRLTADVRSLLRAGYGLEHVRRAIAVDEQARVEEDGAPQRSRWSRVTTVWLASGIAAAAGGMLLAHSDSTALSLLGLGTAIIAPTIAIRRVVGDWLGGRSLLRRLTQGRLGRWMFGAASIGLGDRPVPRVAGAEPTVVAIARAADELYLGLPDESRRQLGDVQTVINRLAAEVLALHRSDGPAGEREAAAVAALESLRLDLLRLSAGGAPTGELTRDLDEAARIGERIDARLAGRDDPSPVPNG
jgi:eukaryotic-like serine/threonine-protein kinase